MKANLDAWKAMHQDLADKMKALASQPKRAGCIGPLAAMEDDFTSHYNHYADVYNDIQDSNLNVYLGTMQNIEEAMLKIKDEIAKAPSICY